MTEHSTPTDQEQIEIREERPSHFYRTELPNIVEDILTDPYEFRVYMHFKRKAGDKGYCSSTNLTIAESCGMSKGKFLRVKKSLSLPRTELEGRSLIKITQRITSDGGRDTDLIAIVPIWDLNAKEGGAR